jgi:hypothetical protein
VALGQVFSENFGFPCQSTFHLRFSTIIFTITRGWHNRTGVAAVPIASQTELKKKKVESFQLSFRHSETEYVHTRRIIIFSLKAI